MEDDGDRTQVPWLSDMVENELQALFSEDRDEIARAVLHFLRASTHDPEIEEHLIELLELAMEHGNDDGTASVWAVVILGEMGTSRPIPFLQRALMAEGDEVLQDAARVALLRIGTSAIESLLTTIDEEGYAAFNRNAYSVLAMVGFIHDDVLSRRVIDFLQERLEIERRTEKSESALEELIQAIARLGDRTQIEPIREILQSNFGGSNPAIQDSLEFLQENTDGVPIVTDLTPWEERYGWIFEKSEPRARLTRDEEGRISMEYGAEE